MAAPVMVVLVILGKIEIFKWMLPLSFFTDLIDGTLARKFKVTSVFGSRLDSIGDDLTVLSGVIGLFVFKADFIRQNSLVVIILAALLIIQNTMALVRYKKLSSFHTYSAKVAALLQGLFLIQIFLMSSPSYVLFYCAVAISAIDLTEEIILVLMLKEYKTDVKGIYWVLKQGKK
jgi:CDP-diacylglycerol--glycerol-3-phosphate 3-phosphatidyltransferase